MTRDERRWCLTFGLVVAVATTLPYVWAYVREGASWRFSGFLFGVEDGNSYLAKMLEGAYGAWRFRTPYTTFPQTGILAFLPYLILGKLAAGPALHEQLVALYHAARFLAAPLGALATYGLAARFLNGIAWRRWATILATVGGGAGWLLVTLGHGSLSGSFPLEFFSPESFGFLAYLGLPHLVVGRALLLFGLAWYLDASRGSRSAYHAGVALLLLGLFQPLAVVSAWAVILTHFALVAASGAASGNDLRPASRAVGHALLLSSPVVIYYGWLSLADPFVRAWNAQNILPSPHPIHYLVAYGPMMAVALAGGVHFRSRGSLLLAGWILLLPFLAYAPVPVQRRLPDGVWVAIVVLAASALEARPAVSSRRMGLGMVLVTIPSSLFLVAGSFLTASQPQPPSFVPSPAADAYEALAEKAVPGDTVIASFETGNQLPAWAPVRVLAGHGPESVGLAAVMPQVEAFYAPGTADPTRQSILREHQVRFVFEGPSEERLGSWDPASAPYLHSIYSSGEYRIFAVSAVALAVVDGFPGEK